MGALQAATVSAAVSCILILVITKAVIANATTLDGTALVPGVLGISFIRNSGISFGLFAQTTLLGTAALVVFEILITVLLSIWAYKEKRIAIAAAVGIIVAGALAIVVDRAVHGSVFDFLYFHLGAIPLFVCNVSDIAISLGFIILVVDQFFIARMQHG